MFPYLFLLPALLLIVFFVYAPFLMALYYSFTEYHIFQPEVFIGLSNYSKLLADARFWNACKNTAIYFAAAVPLMVVFPLWLAITVNNKLKGIKFFRAAYYLPVIVSMVVIGITWKWLYAENGLINYVFTVLLPIFGEKISWLTDKRYSLMALVVVTVWKSTGYYMVIYLAGLQSVSKDLYEAGELDGATGWRKHWFITAPMISPYIIVVAVLACINALQVFDEVFVMTKGGPYRTTETIMYYIYELSVVKFDIGYATAMGMILFIALAVLTYINYSLSLKGSGYDYEN